MNTSATSLGTTPGQADELNGSLRRPRADDVREAELAEPPGSTIVARRGAESAHRVKVVVAPSS